MPLLFALSILSSSPLLRAVVTEQLTGITVTTPATILDSDEADGDPTTNRHGLETVAEMRVTRTFSDPVVSANYRVAYSLFDSNGTPLPLRNADRTTGNQIAYSEPVNVTFAGIFDTTPQIRILDLAPDPIDTLSPNETYRVQGLLQRQTGATTWITANGPVTSGTSDFHQVTHFTNLVSGDKNYNMRGLLSNLTLSREHLVDTIPALASLPVSVDARLGRYDDFDAPVSTLLGRYTIDFDLLDSSSNSVPLENDGIVNYAWRHRSYDDTSGRPLPDFDSFTVNTSLRPLAQLNSVNETYTLRCTLRHLEDPLETEFVDMQSEVAPAIILHFNGTLLFGGFTTTFTDLANIPAPGATGLGYVETTLAIPADGGVLPGNSGVSYGNGTPLGVQLDLGGTASLALAGQKQAVYPTGDPLGTISLDLGGIKLTYDDPVVLDSNGLRTATATVHFPQGLGYIADRFASEFRGAPRYEFPGPFLLQPNLRPPGNLSVTLGPSAAFFDESHPLVFDAGDLTVDLSGQVTITTTQGAYIHDDSLNTLEFLESGGMLDHPSMKERCSNDLYWRPLTTIQGNTLTWLPGPDGSARMNGSFELDPSRWLSHFPRKTEIETTSTGYIEIFDGATTPNSRLLEVAGVRLPYDINCPGDPCGGDGEVIVDFQPSDQALTVSPTGGLWNAGFVPPTELRWGARGDGGGGVTGYAHRTGPFDEGTFFMPGYQLYASDNAVLQHPVYAAAGGDHAPATLLLAGHTDDEFLPSLWQPGQFEYRQGSGSYAGLNFTVRTDSFEGASRLGGASFDFPYVLLGNGASKYYIRKSGVSGRQVGKDGTYDSSLVYDYLFQFNSFQMSFLSSEQAESWINGEIFVDGYSNFSQRFLGLTLDCVGELIEAELDPDDVSDKSLTYWKSSFKPLSMVFTKVERGGCPQEFEGFLTMGAQTEVAHVPGTLYGIFGFKPDGNLITPADEIGELTGELGIPATISLAGPNKDYRLNTTGKLRLNNPVPAGDPPGSIDGFVTFAATVDIPYFRDLQVQAVTSASSAPEAPFYLTPGWNEAGATFFDSATFDPNHRSWPITSLPLGEYLNPTPATFGSHPNLVLHAEQDMFGLIGLDYPLEWDDSLRRFKSLVPREDEAVFVIDIDHQVPYLDAKFAQIDFGAKYDGLPQVSLTNVLNDQIDGAADALADSITSALKGALDEAVEQFTEMLSDNLIEAFDPVIEEAALQVLCPTYDQLRTTYEDARDLGLTYAAWDGANLIAILDAQLHKPSFVSELETQLLKIAQAGQGAASFVDELKAALEDMILGIDAIANSVQVVDGSPVFFPDLETIPGGARPGLLAETAGQRDIIASLTRLLLEELVAPDIAAILTPLLLSPASELQAELAALLDEIDPALDLIVESLNTLREFLVIAHQQLCDTTALFRDLETIVTEAAMAGDLDVILSEVRFKAFDLLSDLRESHGILPTDPLDAHLSIFDDISKEDFVAALQSELRDALTESPIVEQVKYLLRENLYDLELKFRNTIQSIFGQISEVMKEVVSSTIGSLEKKINPLLGAVSDYMGAGEITGFAEFNGDSLRKLRMDGRFEWKIPEEMQLHAYLEVLAYNSEDNFVESGCVSPGDEFLEVRVGAVDVPCDWISDGLRASVEVKMSLKNGAPHGVGGSFELTGGEIDFQSFTLTCFASTLMVSGDECYFGAKVCGRFSGYELSVGIFFGRTCTLDPLYLVDPDVAEVLDPGGTFTGAYVYGEVWLPISEIVLGIPASCLFRVSAGIGAGAFYFIEGPTYGGKILAGVSGEALCIVSFKGEVKMVGVSQAGRFKASGSGSFEACAGWCPFCICFSARVKLKYNNGSWSVDY